MDSGSASIYDHVLCGAKGRCKYWDPIDFVKLFWAWNWMGKEINLWNTELSKNKLLTLIK